MERTFRVLKDFVLDTYDFEKLIKDGLIEEIKPEDKMKPKKWTIEWAIRKYGAEYGHTFCGIWTGYKCGDRVVAIFDDWHGGYAKETYPGSAQFPMKFDSERAAVRWLVADQPRVEKRKWVLEKKWDSCADWEKFKMEPGERYEVTCDKLGVNKIKYFKRSTPDEKAEK